MAKRQSISNSAQHYMELLDKELVRIMHSHAMRLGIYLTPGTILSADYEQLRKYSKTLKEIADWLEDFDMRMEHYYAVNS